MQFSVEIRSRISEKSLPLRREILAGEFSRELPNFVVFVDKREGNQNTEQHFHVKVPKHDAVHDYRC